MESKLPERLARHTRGTACVGQTQWPSGVTGAQQAQSHPGARAGWLPCQQDSGRVLIHLDEALMQADSSDCGPARRLLERQRDAWGELVPPPGRERVTPRTSQSPPCTVPRAHAPLRHMRQQQLQKNQWTQASAQWALQAAPSKGSTEAPRPCGSCQTSPHLSPRLHARSLTFRRAPRGPPPSLSCPRTLTLCRPSHPSPVDHPAGPPRMLPTSRGRPQPQ